MNALAATPADLQVGWLLIGIFLGFTGACFIFASLRDEKAAAKAEAIVTETPEERAMRLFDAECDKPLAAAAVEVEAHRRLAPLADVVDLRGGRK